MDKQAFTTARQWFEKLCDLPAERQQQALRDAELSADVLALVKQMLQADQHDVPLTVSAQSYSESPAVQLHKDTLLGPWRILQPLGQGGMGAVYLAERADGKYTQQVAVKLLTAGAGGDALARFQLERQILAQLNHPNIAHLLDAGEHDDGTPYLVMEYVQGLPIQEYVRTKALDARQIVGLVVQVAEAIAHAQQRQILHRDLKPANIMVDERGLVKVLDFGIAKIMDGGGSKDQAATMILTIRYAAPEQLRGEIATAATDVFALGLVLFELLTGQHPFQQSGHDDSDIASRLLTREAKALRGSDGETIQRVPKSLRRDLQSVLAKALRSQPEHRYSHAQAFAEDLKRCLRGEPVLARPRSTGYILMSWARRHRLAAALAVTSVLILVLATSVSLWQANEARKARDIAQQEQATTAQINDFLTALLVVSQALAKQG